MNNAYPCELFSAFGRKTYHVETFQIGSCVCNESGYNCLRFRDKPGACFTTLEEAQEICDQWNKNAS